MIILAFDQSIRNTGWALYDTNRPLSAIEVGSFSSAPEARMEHEEKLAIFGRALKRLFVSRRPEFCAWEAAEDFIRRYDNVPKADLAGRSPAPAVTVNPDQLVLRDIQGQIRQACIDWKVQYEKVAPATWRVAFLGKGNGRLSRDASKKAAIDRCGQIKVPVTNGDQAEAVGVAFWASSHCQSVKLLERARAA
jgi:hypothetical protein